MQLKTATAHTQCYKQQALAMIEQLQIFHFFLSFALALSAVKNDLTKTIEHKVIEHLRLIYEKEEEFTNKKRISNKSNESFISVFFLT